MKPYRHYRIRTYKDALTDAPVYCVQVKGCLCFWHNVKIFYDPQDPDFAKREAEELLEHLELA